MPISQIPFPPVTITGLTPTRIGNLDYLDTASSGIATQVTNLSATVSALTLLNSAPQYGTVAVTGGNTSGTKTITSVNTAKAVLIYLGSSNTSAAVNQADTNVRITLTDATTVTAERSGTTGSVTVSFVVVEFN